MNLDRILRWGLALLVLLLLLWLSQVLEWVEVDTDKPAQGAAATNPWYASQSLITRLGGKVVQGDTLLTLPPPRATLVLTSPHWDLFPGNLERLRQWVAQGGNLVIPAHFLEQKKFKQWIAIEQLRKKVEKKPAPQTAPDDEDEDEDLPVTKDCHATTEQRAGASASHPPRSFQVCAYTYSTLQTQLPVLWGIRNAEGFESLRIAMAQGTVTVLETDDIGIREELFRADNAQVWVAALNLRNGADIWFVLNEKRPPLLTWLWTRGWVAVLLCLGVVALALWRHMPRFGPIAPSPAVARRSMAEQVRGTAQFLRQRSIHTLYQAQLRAFDDAAVRHVPHYRSLGLPDRAQGVARLTQLDAAALAHALREDIQRSPFATLHALQLLETARRRLRKAMAPAAPSSLS